MRALVSSMLEFPLDMHTAPSTRVPGWHGNRACIAPGVITSVVMLALFANLMDPMRSTRDLVCNKSKFPNSYWQKAIVATAGWAMQAKDDVKRIITS